MGPSPQQRLTIAISAPLSRADLPRLFERACALLEGIAPEVLCCEVAAVAADAVGVEALARLALAARRHGAQLLISGASPELRSLVELMGLSDVLAVPSRPALEAGRTAGRSYRWRGRT
jgi:ABC-type transporter Mla MlaB component